tara:strand:+ start:69 stop:323 length:255 start_codon:yes stop_codon:yes gene_type:complete
MTEPFTIPQWDHNASFNEACDELEKFIEKHKEEGPLVMISLVRALTVQMVNMSDGEDKLNDFVEMAIGEIHSMADMAKQSKNYE